MHFVKGYANYIKICPYQSPPLAIHEKPQEYIECPRIHSTQDYRINKPSLKDLNLGSCYKKKVQNLDLGLTCLSWKALNKTHQDTMWKIMTS